MRSSGAGQPPDHFMPSSLLDSQFATLQPLGPDERLVIEVDQNVEAIVPEYVDRATVR